MLLFKHQYKLHHNLNTILIRILIDNHNNSIELGRNDLLWKLISLLSNVESYSEGICMVQ